MLRCHDPRKWQGRGHRKMTSEECICNMDTHETSTRLIRCKIWLNGAACSGRCREQQVVWGPGRASRKGGGLAGKQLKKCVQELPHLQQ